MSTPLKIFLWVIGIVGGLVTLFIIASLVLSFYFMDDINDAMDGLGEFSQTASKVDCVDEMAKRLKKCDADGLMCTMKAAGFGSACAEMSKDSDEALCEIYLNGNWKETFCESNKLAIEQCILIKEVLIERCPDNS